jgi:hypothetical protein
VSRRPLYRYVIAIRDARRGDDTITEWAPSPAAAARQCRARAHRAHVHAIHVDPTPDAVTLPCGTIVALHPRVPPDRRAA